MYSSLSKRLQEVSISVIVVVWLLSCLQLFCKPWTPSVGFPSPFSKGKNTGMGCHFLLQGVFSTQGSNLCLLHCQADSLTLSHQGIPFLLSFPNFS